MSRVLLLPGLIPLLCLSLLASAAAQPPPQTSAEPSAVVPAAPPVQSPTDQSPPNQSPPNQSPPVQSQPAQSPPALAPPAQSPPAQSPPVVPAEQVAPAELTGLVGQAVQGTAGNEVGRIVNLLADGQGHVRAVVVDVGGFMGVGNRKVALAWSALHFDMGDKGPVVSTAIPLDRIRSWADYIPGRPIAILGAPGSAP
jgi:hypothetical protein